MPNQKITAMTTLAIGTGVSADLLTLVQIAGPTNVSQTLGDFFGQIPLPVRAGTPAGVVGSIGLFNANNANLVTLTVDTPAAALNYILPNASPTVGQVLSASAPSGANVTLTWVAQTAATTPAGASTQVQFNNAGAFGASANLTWVSPTLTIGAASSTTGNLTLANAAGATTTTFRAGNAASTLAFVWPVVDPTLGQVLSASAPAGAVVTLSWATVSATPGGSTTQVQYNNAGAFGGISGATTNGTATTFTSGNLLATSPAITTGINDANANAMILFTATASAVNQFTFTNGATTASPSIAATGTATNLNITLAPKGTGVVDITKALTLSGQTSTNYTTPAASVVPTAINVVTYDPGGFGQILAMGIGAVASNRRVISIFDARVAAHDPSLAVFSPAETQVGGITWNGSNTRMDFQSSAGLVGIPGRLIQGCPASAVTDGDLANSELSIWANEAITSFTFRFRDSGGTLRTAVLVYT